MAHALRLQALVLYGPLDREKEIFQWLNTLPPCKTVKINRTILKVSRKLAHVFLNFWLCKKNFLKIAIKKFFLKTQNTISTISYKFNRRMFELYLFKPFSHPGRAKFQILPNLRSSENSFIGQFFLIPLQLYHLFQSPR